MWDNSVDGIGTCRELSWSCFPFLIFWLVLCLWVPMSPIHKGTCSNKRMQWSCCHGFIQTERNSHFYYDCLVDPLLLSSNWTCSFAVCCSQEPGGLQIVCCVKALICQPSGCRSWEGTMSNLNVRAMEQLKTVPAHPSPFNDFEQLHAGQSWVWASTDRFGFVDPLGLLNVRIGQSHLLWSHLNCLQEQRAISRYTQQEIVL